MFRGVAPSLRTAGRIGAKFPARIIIRRPIRPCPTPNPIGIYEKRHCLYGFGAGCDAPDSGILRFINRYRKTLVNRDDIQLLAQKPVLVCLSWMNDRTVLMDAGLGIDNVNEIIRTSIPDENFDTLGGFIYHQLGFIPEGGEEIKWEDIIFKIKEIDGNRISKVIVVLNEPFAKNEEWCTHTRKIHLYGDSLGLFRHRLVPDYCGFF